MAVYRGMRSVRAIWPVLLVAGGSFAISQSAASNLLDYSLTDVLSSLGSLIATLLFLQLWKPRPDAEFAIRADNLEAERELTQAGAKPHVAPWQGWLPWLIVLAVVIAWTDLKVFTIGQQAIHWPGLHNAVSITLYGGKPYAAVWVFQPLTSPIS